MNAKKKRQFRGLVLQAFADAWAKGKEDWRTMQLSVLKNRLLQRTERRFREADYGADSLAELVRRLPDDLAIAKGRFPAVRLL